MTDLERILSLANHGINKSPEARNTTKILKEAQEQINQLKESDAPEEMAEDIGKYVKQIPQFVKTLGSKSTTDKYSKDKDGKMSHTSTTTKHGHHNMEAYSPGDENEAGMVSNCCGAPIMDVHQGHGRCSDCKEMASAEREEEYYESTEEVVAEAPKLTVSFKNFMQWFFSDSGEDEYAGFGEEVVAEINRVGSVTYTAQDMLDRSGYIPGHIVAGGDEDEEYDPADLTLVETEVTTEDESVARIRKLANVFSSSTEHPTVETVEQNEDKGNE
jgi:hypothetical protein|tara:strand:- start:309 stop:1127 length:819 start_codon:yes stop_codon:yes gene_type:complete